MEGQPERPEALQMQISKLTASNCRMDDKLTQQDLRKALDIYYGSHLFHTAEFPNDSLPHRLAPWQLENHASGKDNPYLDKSVKALLDCDPNLLQWPDTGITHMLTCNSLKMDALCDVWGLHLEQVMSMGSLFTVVWGQDGLLSGCSLVRLVYHQVAVMKRNVSRVGYC